MKYAAIGLAFLLLTVQWTFSQDGAPQPCPDMTAGTLGCELIEWSHLQEPVPLPNPDTNSAPAPDERSAQSENSQEHSRTSAQNNGVVVRQVLAGDKATYQPNVLNDENAAGNISTGK
jgi:hypothetical protein